jgi:hypothetical protein
MKLKLEARWATRWSLIIGSAAGVVAAVFSERPPDGGFPGVSLGLEAVWRAQLFMLATLLVAVSAFLVLLSFRGLLIVDILEPRRRRRRFR